MGAFLGGNRVSMAMIVGNSGAKLKTLLDATKSTYYLFYKYKGTTVEGLIDYDDTENVTDMSYLFYYCTNLTSVPLLNTQNATNMRSMFSYCETLTTVPLFNTENVTSMEDVFSGCFNLTTVPLFNTENVTIMSDMFQNCRALTTVPLFNTENVITMDRMFGYCYNLTSVPLFNTQNVTNMTQMFYDCRLLETVSVNAEKVNHVSNMFGKCGNLKKVKLSKVSSKIYNSSQWFEYCSSLEVIDFSDAISVPTLSNLIAFTNVPTTCKIVIPDSLYDTWTTATNWNALTQQFVKASEYTEA